jgi:hypothetical protein
MRVTSLGNIAIYRSTGLGPSGLPHARRGITVASPETQRWTLYRTDVEPGRPTTAQCRDFTLNRSANWTQLT